MISITQCSRRLLSAITQVAARDIDAIKTKLADLDDVGPRVNPIIPDRRVLNLNDYREQLSVELLEAESLLAAATHVLKHKGD